jgi:hypothetical protein
VKTPKVAQKLLKNIFSKNRLQKQPLKKIGTSYKKSSEYIYSTLGCSIKKQYSAGMRIQGLY